MSASTAPEPTSRRRAPLRGGIVLLALVGCQAPFGSDRHRLEGFRIAGVQLTTVDATSLQAAPLLVVEGRLWSDAPTDLAWVWLDEDEEAATWTGRADAGGTWPTLQIPEGGGSLLLVAMGPDGTTRRAVARVDDTLGEPPDVALELSPGRSVNEGQKLTCENIAASATDRVTRWMSTAGRWRELDADTARWTPLLPGIASLVALQTADGAGGKWQVVDVAVGARDDGAWVGGRWIPGAIDGWQQVTLVADDDGPSGLAAADVVPVDPTTLVGDDPYLTAGLPCTGPRSAADGFLPDWLVDGRCLRADLVGATVVLFGETDP